MKKALLALLLVAGATQANDSLIIQDNDGSRCEVRTTQPWKLKGGVDNGRRGHHYDHHYRDRPGYRDNEQRAYFEVEYSFGGERVEAGQCSNFQRQVEERKDLELEAKSLEIEALKKQLKAAQSHQQNNTFNQ